MKWCRDATTIGGEMGLVFIFADGEKRKYKVEGCETTSGFYFVVSDGSLPRTDEFYSDSALGAVAYCEKYELAPRLNTIKTRIVKELIDAAMMMNEQEAKE